MGWFFSRKKQQPSVRNSLEALSGEDLEARLAITKYGDFELTDAVRPATDDFVPQRGYKYVWIPWSNVPLSVLTVAETKDNLLPLFYDFLDTFQGQEGEVLQVDIALEGTHDRSSSEEHVDYWSEDVDYPVLCSHLIDFENLLLNDGCSGITVIHPLRRIKVRFDEHKLFQIYGRSEDLKPFENIFQWYGTPYEPNLQLIKDSDHAHETSEEFEEQFQRLKVLLGADEEGD